MSCDPNYNDAGYSFKTGLNSMLKRCLYGKTINEYPFEYANLFWESYKDNKKKEVVINDNKNNEEKKIENKLTSNDETFDIFQRKEKKEEKKIVGLFADIGLFNESKSSFDKKEKKEEPKKTGDISTKMNMFESGNKNNEKNINIVFSAVNMDIGVGFLIKFE